MEIKWFSYILDSQLSIHCDHVGKCAEGLNITGLSVKRFDHGGQIPYYRDYPVSLVLVVVTLFSGDT